MSNIAKSAALGLLLSFAAGAACAQSVVSVELWGKSEEPASGLGMGMNGDMTQATMGIRIEPASVKAGKVRFQISNAAAETYHQMLLSPVAATSEALPFVADQNQVDVTSMTLLGDDVTLKGHDMASVTLDLAPGTYVLFCNVPGHFMAGMWTTLEVTE